MRPHISGRHGPTEGPDPLPHATDDPHAPDARGASTPASDAARWSGAADRRAPDTGERRATTRRIDCSPDRRAGADTGRRHH
ncbi:hypothetical protein [Roseisolibacter agri]|uniref:Uncharacterized protein n=1 Tax=Roseisolibacter agri TaxID=2014610 RepID=A0AA37Q6J9_9BACT|nr:hypothetical protein [Roseisolibacter agri]GLC25627.1 hypothetical protein rosag_21400 [Roseisolibacter agri]